MRCPARPARPRRPASGRRRPPGRTAPRRSRSRTTVPTGTGTTRSLPRAPCFLLPRAVAAVGGPPVGMVPEAEQGGLVDRGHEPDVAAVATVPAVGPAPVDVGLAPARHRAGAPVAGLGVELGLIDEAAMRSSLRGKEAVGPARRHATRRGPARRRSARARRRPPPARRPPRRRSPGSRRRPRPGARGARRR